ncbi:MAG: hypothetical protein FWD27_02735 [Coriobacteriia bacterium]|nr:hypothetical protein [Coriobacteriia bacterium]
MKSDVTYSVSATNVERVATEISSAELTGLVIPEYEYEGDYDLYSFTLGQDHLLILSAVSTAQPTKNIRGHAIALDRNSSSLLDSMVSAQERTDGTTYGAYVLWHVPSSFLYTYLAICALIIAGLLLLCLFVAKRSNNQKDVIRLRGMGGGGYNVRR